jgi:proline racemase
MEPEDTPPMSGSNSICVATVILETGIVAMTEPETQLLLEAPGGLVHVTAHCDAGKVRSVRVRNVPSFACALDLPLVVPGLGRLKVDTAYGGDSFVVVNVEGLGFELVPREAKALAEIGVRITNAATEQLGFSHPENPDWTHISFCLFAAPVRRHGDVLETRHAVAIRPGKIDRSPTGTGVSARLALLHARQAIAPGESLVAQSIIGSRFTGRIESETTVGGLAAIVPSIEGRAWRTGSRQVFVDPDDPWPEGYRISDTWPGA